MNCVTTPLRVEACCSQRSVIRCETHEKGVVASFLNFDGCLFVLRRVEADHSTSLFRVLFDFAAGKLGYERSFPVFCRELAGAALLGGCEWKCGAA